MLHMRSKLYLGLKSTKLTRLLEGDRVRSIQDVIPCLKHMKKEGIQGLHFSKWHIPDSRQVLQTSSHSE